jgi:hypothetical protein
MKFELKKLLYNYCESFLKRKLTNYQNQKKELFESLESETKSSAGDKHETGRAMIQLEIEKLGNQIREAEKEHTFLKKNNNKIISSNIQIGTIVKTKKNIFYVMISAGIFKYKSKKIYCISQKSPIGALLIGKKVNDNFIFNNEKIEILNII